MGLERVMEAAATLEMAGIGTAIECADEALAQALRQRYTGFPLEGGIDARISARIGQGAEIRGGSQLQIILEGEIVKMVGANTRGTFNVEQRFGELEADPMDALMSAEYFLRVVYALLVFEKGGLLLHAAGIARDGRVYLFIGQSGAGKTTVARHSGRDLVLNDDLVIVLPEGDGWTAYATPFWSSQQVRPTRSSAPLAGLLRLVQDRNVYLEPMGSGQALAELSASAIVAAVDPRRSAEVLRRGAHMLASLPAYRLHFLPDDSFWSVIDF